MNHTTKSVATLDAHAAPFGHGSTYWLGRSEGQGPVRPMAVVVIDEDANDVLEMRWAEDQKPVKTLGASGPYESLRHAIGVSRQLHRPTSGAPQTFRVTHPFHPLLGRVFPLIECRQTWGEYRVFFHDDSGELARLPRQWTDLIPADPTVRVGAGRAHFRYDDLCRLADLLTRLAQASGPSGS